MNKVVGILLLGLSLLTSAIVISLGQISRAIKQAATGNFGYDIAFLEIPWIVYILILVVLCLAFYLLGNKNSK